MTKLSVNLNKVALLRNTRTLGIPSVLRAATISVEAGAHGITVHPRPDGRHIRAGDVRDLAGWLAAPERAGIEFNMEGNPFAPGFLDLVREARPTQCTMVPDAPEAFTSDHGWDLGKDGGRVAPVIADLRRQGIRVSLFMDPDLAQVERVPATGADRIELYTEPYARAFTEGKAEASLRQYAEAARKAGELGLGVNAGHDLNRENLGPFLRAVPGVLEVSIGHALIADALELGLATTVKEYLRVIAGA
jgi:pyridoxine 5-phosphate synthase